MREYHYQVDRDGRIFHDGTEIVDAPTLRFFLRAMKRTADGHCLVVCQGEQNWFEAQDTPFVVQRLRLTAPDGVLQAVDLEFLGGYREPMNPDSLETEGGHLFSSVRQGAFRARFGRVAIQQIAPFIVDRGGPGLALGGCWYPIREVRALCTG